MPNEIITKNFVWTPSNELTAVVMVETGVLEGETDVEDNVMEKASSFKFRNPGSRYHDQDGLNVAMRHKWFTLHPRWNVQSFMFKICYNGKLRNQFPPEIIEAVKNPAIIHYTEAIKPWHYECEMPMLRNITNILP